jgi:hypothetical protein
VSAALTEAGMWRRTLLVFSADNGGVGARIRGRCGYYAAPTLVCAEDPYGTGQLRCWMTAPPA